MKGNTCKIADFGLTRQNRSYSNGTALTEYISTRWYRAPEVLLRDPNYSASIDIFAVGCVMAELISLNPIFPGTSEIDQTYRILNVLGFPNDENWPDGRELVERMSFTIPSEETQISHLPNTHIYRTRLALNHMFPDSSTETLSFLQKLLTLDPKERPPANFALHDDFFQAKITSSDIITANCSPGNSARSSGGSNKGIQTPSLEIERSQKRAKLIQKKRSPTVSDKARIFGSDFSQSSAMDSCQSFPLHSSFHQNSDSCNDQGIVAYNCLPSFSNGVASSVIQNTKASFVPIFRHRNGLQQTRSILPIERNHFTRNLDEYI